MMTLGTIAAFGFDDFHPPEVLGLYKRAGCELVQAYRNTNKNVSPGEIISLCSDLGLRIDSLHAVFGDELDPSSEDEAVRRRTVEAYRPELDLCRRLGGRVIVVHPDPPKAPVGNAENRWSQLARSVGEFARLSESAGVQIAIENMPGYHPIGHEVKRLADTIDAHGNGRVVFLIDTGHAHMTCGVGAAIRAAGRRIGYTHVHDNDGVNDTHRLPYTGTLPWDECREAFHEVGYDGVFLLEVFNSAEELRKLLNDEWKRRIGRILDNGPSRV